MALCLGFSRSRKDRNHNGILDQSFYVHVGYGVACATPLSGLRVLARVSLKSLEAINTTGICDLRSPSCVPRIE